MRRSSPRSALFIGILLSVPSVAAQGTSPIEDVTNEVCEALLPDPEAALVALAPDIAETAAFSLTMEALIRHCGSLGVITIEGEDAQDETRATGRIGPDEDQSVSLRREARYYLETAMQIDPDASNDLLRRLLGREPRPLE